MSVLLGEVRIFSYGKIPAGWLACEGQILYITEYPKLYMLIGTKFGGGANWVYYGEYSGH